MCKKCEIEPVYEFTNKRKLCKTCFIRWFQKKFLYTLRKYQMIQREERIGFYEKKDFRGVVLKNLLESFSGKAGSEIKKISQKNKKNFDKLALEDTADYIVKEFSVKIINGDIYQAKKLYPVSNKIIRPLFLFLDKEVRLYAELNNLNFNDLNKNETEISGFIKELESKHPELKTSVVSSFLKLFS